MLLIFPFFYCQGANTLDEKYGHASAKFDGEKLVVNTGAFERSWVLKPYGLVTTSIKNLTTGKNWATAEPSNCDWEYYGLIDQNTQGKLIGIEAVESTDSGFTSPHLLVVAEFQYPEVETFVKYEIRAYPNAEGLFTRVAFKGLPSKYIEKVNRETNIRFNLVDGKEKYDYAMHGFTEDYIANYVVDTKKIEYLVEGLDKAKKYEVNLSWWDFKTSNIVQRVSVSSVDGENVYEIINAREVPSHLKKQKPEELSFELPPNVLLDGSFRLIIEKVSGEKVTLSEIWINEKGDKNHYIAGNTDRIDLLRENMKDGYTLAGYLNCGERNKVEVSQISGRVDFLPVDAAKLTRRYVGYYNDTQHRNKRETHLLKEELLTAPLPENEKNTWASVLYLEDRDEVLIVVKESHKCVNQYGYDTGDYELSKQGISNTGTGLSPVEVLPYRYRHAWASWVICGENSDEGRQLALKKFERQRFPVNPKTDIYIIANTWGSDRGINAATESNAIIELKSQHYLGIDVQQIDDGWQKNNAGKQTVGWYPTIDKFPNGFERVKNVADSLGMKLGLWFAAQPVKLQEMKDNHDAGGFSYYKLDFANLRNHDQIEQMIEKIRAYELYTDHKSKVNWDVTENAPRFGYFWAKEYGCVFLENRKPKFPENVVYTPYLVLRDLWHLSKYCNLNKFQGSVQNIDKVDTLASDAYLHNHPYSAAIPLMSTPLFFQETQFYSPEAKEQIKKVLTAYKQVRYDIYQSFVFPLGEEPDNASWTGFQAHHPTKNIGFINIFREINNSESVKKIQLKFLKNQKIEFTDLMTNKSFSFRADKDGFVEFNIDNACDFRMLKYSY
ncbi:hypothetical protein LH29_08170 [Draconibacterium sediminis]|uniref:Alpha-galactosidase n=1 Tax=Draconibacterium sediminis TaxID=1544798 RepID=A0A0D8JEL2_9BACT|nr:hypothetical protein LH29_08170 [Draconibacterium sediminis]